MVWKEDCRYCDLTKKFLRDKGIEFTTEEVTEDNFQEVVNDRYGFRQVPVVVTDADTWSGWNLEKLKELVK